MKKTCYAGILLLLIIMLVACSGVEDSSRDEQVISEEGYLVEEPISELEEEPIELEPEDESEKKDQPEPASPDLEPLPADEADVGIPAIGQIYYSPFTGEPVDEFYIRKALMVIIENSPQARPQSGLEEASIIYEFLVEGGITRFLALYWDRIPDKIGPVRSARPYLIETASEYDALLLHAGASPEGFAMLARGQLAHLDQIFNGQYYWRSSDRRAPHNLYTGSKRIERYLDQLIGQEYNDRFDFQRVSFVRPDDKKADFIKIPYWGGTTVLYRYNREENLYYRYYGFMETPHFLDNNIQLTAKNIIIQYVGTRVLDEEGRLEMELGGSGKVLFFKDGIVVEGYWKKDGDSFTQYYNQQGEKLTFNPGQTWIHIVPSSIEVLYQDSSEAMETEEAPDEDVESITDIEGVEEIEDIDGNEDIEGNREPIEEEVKKDIEEDTEKAAGQAEGPEEDRPAEQEGFPPGPGSPFNAESIDNQFILDLLESSFPFNEND